jgi:hypothetical protein
VSAVLGFQLEFFIVCLGMVILDNCYVVRGVNNLYFAKSKQNKKIYKFYWPDDVVGKAIYLCGDCYGKENLIRGSGSCYSITKDDEENWSVYQLKDGFQLSFERITPPEVLWQIQIIQNSKWKCGDRVIIVTGISDFKSQFDGKIEYTLKKGKRKSHLSIQNLITNYKPV